MRRPTWTRTTRRRGWCHAASSPSSTTSRGESIPAESSSSTSSWTRWIVNCNSLGLSINDVLEGAQKLTLAEIGCVTVTGREFSQKKIWIMDATRVELILNALPTSIQFQGFVPQNNDGEVQGFELVPVKNVVEKICSSEFKVRSRRTMVAMTLGWVN